ncbi:MAG TPA: HIT family protein [Candidatus Binataceae bacterium]|nr:HIT family protein [Candidatus Binataceae bacterium]
MAQETPRCIFCAIVRGEIPASIVAETDSVLAFMDIQPVNPGHVLVIPKSHATYLADLDSRVGEEIFRLAMRVADGLRRSGIRCEGVNLFLADGFAAGQEVFHVHLHVFPRFEGDGFGLRFGPKYGAHPPREELERIAGSIKASMR